MIKLFREMRRGILGGVIAGVILAGAAGVSVEAQAPFSAQIQAALRVFLTQAHTWTGTQVYTTIVVGGTPVPATGAIRLANNTFIKTVSANGLTDYNLLGVDNGNNASLGDGNFGFLSYLAGAHRFKIGSTSVWDINGSGNIVDDGSHTIVAGGYIQTGDAFALGGTSASFPAILKSGTTVKFRLADNSADTGITASTGAFSSTVSSGNSIYQFGAAAANGSLSAVSDGVIQLKNNATTGFTRLILGTNDATANGFSFVNTSGDVELKTGDGSSRTGLRVGALSSSSTGAFAGGVSGGSTSQFSVDVNGALTRYKNGTTAGWGVPSIVAAGRSTAQTAAVASVTTYTVGAADGSFVVDANVLATTSTSYTFAVNVVYTDEGNSVRTVPMNFNLSGGGINNAVSNANGPVFMGLAVHIRAKAATAITVTTTGTFTTVTYNVEGSIRQIA